MHKNILKKFNPKFNPKNLVEILINFLSQEYHQLFLWSPIALIIGINLSLDSGGISSTFLITIFSTLIISLFLTRKNIIFLFISIILFSFLLGVTSSYFRDLEITKEKTNISGEYLLSGQIVDMKPSKRMSMSLIIQVDEIFEFEQNPYLDKIKTSVPMRYLNGAMLGDTIILRTSLHNNDYILFPGGYDFGFKSKYEGIQANGYCLEKIKIVKDAKKKSFWSLIFDIRNYIYSKFLKNMTRDHANFAAAIILGETGGLSSETLNNMRLAGISHILCVSGLHLSLITGIFFVTIRFFLNLFDYVAFRFNIKKIAGFLAIIASIIYLYLSGLQIAATRAFIMTTIFMIAIIFDRSIYPIRSISLATMIMLTKNPEYLYHPSFQLSFMAVLSLISGFEILSQNKHLIVSQTKTLFSRIYFYVISNIYSSIIASVFTAPIVVYHFYFFSNYSIIANLVAVPIMSFFMMPIAIFSLFLMPMGLEKYPLKLLEFFIDIVIKSAKYIVALPYSIWQIGYISKWSLTLFLVSFFWFVIWKSKIRYLGLGVSFLSFVFMLNSEKPALIFDVSNHKNPIMGINENGVLKIYGKKATKFYIENMTHWFGQDEVFFMKNDILDGEFDKTIENNNTDISLNFKNLNCDADFVFNYVDNEVCNSQTITKDKILNNGRLLVFCKNKKCKIK